tara:strand:- start:439 stop:849 length:411 start_codon:yes stop_codon:yes gene_type:complete
MKFIYIVILIFLLPAVVTAGEENEQHTAVCEDCGAVQVYREVQCKLVSLYFKQAAEGAVAIRLYDESGTIIYDRYSSDRTVRKQREDKYTLCEGIVRRAVKVTITRCTPGIATPISYVGNVLRAFRESRTDPVQLP